MHVAMYEGPAARCEARARQQMGHGRQVNQLAHVMAHQGLYVCHQSPMSCVGDIGGFIGELKISCGSRSSCVIVDPRERR
jgi:hypothetical protein